MLIEELKARLAALMRKLHANQGGAVALLCLAAILIIFLLAMTMWDAADGARDKMDVQVAADTAALSHASVKARAMNMISYANITKRILYAYNAIYISAFLALIEATGYYLYEAARHAANAIKGLPACVTIVGCAYPISEGVKAIDNAIVAVYGIVQIILETIEFLGVTGARLYGLPIGGDQWRSAKEVAALDYYQEYMTKMGPWWAWGEAVTRGMRNGASLVGTHPIPQGKASDIRDKIRFAMNGINALFGVIPRPDDLLATTSNSDELPLEQVPTPVSLGPFAAIGVGKFIAHMKMCGTVLSSPDFWLMSYFFDHWQPSEGYWDMTRKPLGASFAPRTLVTMLEIVQMPLGCVVAALTLGHEVLPWDLKIGVSSDPTYLFRGNTTPDNWLKFTHNVAITWKEGKGRFSDTGTGRRRKLNFMNDDYNLGGNELYFRNEGYWALTKAEIVYDGGLMSDLAGSFSTGSVPSPFGSALSFLRNWLNEPNMWAPRWTARLRPFAVKGECADPANANCGLSGWDAMYHDSLPFMALTAPLSWLYNTTGFPSDFSSIPSLPDLANTYIAYFEGLAQDIFYMERASKGFPVETQTAGFDR